MKARCYPTASPLSCKVKCNSSWIWKNLMGAREDVQRGARKKIGNGKTIRIWEDAWLQEGKDGKLQSPKPPGCKINRASELISNFRWNSVLIFRTFTQQEARTILKMPIIITGRPDTYFWSHSNNGHYTVSSAYKAMTRENGQLTAQVRLIGETNWTGGSDRVWKQLWKMKIKHISHELFGD